MGIEEEILAEVARQVAEQVTQQSKVDAVMRMLKNNFTEQQISETFEVSLAFIEEVKKQM
ncbi:MAG: hypothetical protein EAZ97_00040 [Bacteroidetes bacterium]|nr:MAG: hypothetical protein EAZ97_00040 [Bacteroidota bacterium]